MDTTTTAFHLALLLAAADEGPGVGVLAQYGVLGIFAALLLVFARTSYKRETDRADRLEADVRRLNDTIQEKVIPALMSATRAAEESAALIADLQRERMILARMKGKADE